MRALYGLDGTRNSCHGSDSPASAAREIKFFFPDLKLDTAAATDDAKVGAGLWQVPRSPCGPSILQQAFLPCREGGWYFTSLHQAA
jgi:hypothetical protein